MLYSSIFLSLLSISFALPKTFVNVEPEINGNDNSETFPTPFGINVKITPEFISELNPLVINIIPQVIKKIELPFPDQIYDIPKFGKVITHFAHIRCQDFKIYDTNPGLYLGNLYIGFKMDFDAICSTYVTINNKLIPQGLTNMTLRGTHTSAEIALDYLSESRKVSPIIKKFDLSFKSVHMELLNHPISNFLLRSMQKLLPAIAAAFFKRAIRTMLPGMMTGFMHFHFSMPSLIGGSSQYHTEFLESPNVGKDGLDVKLVIAKGKEPSSIVQKSDTSLNSYSKVNVADEDRFIPDVLDF